MTQEKIEHGDLLFMCVAGSIAHGTATETSDIDLRGVFAADMKSRLSPFPGIEQIEGPGDRVVFELSKFLRLLIQQNPSILEIAWAPETCVRFTTPVWELLRERRGDLLSRKLRNTYGEYALSQLKRIRGHDKWLSQPQTEMPPRPCDFVSLVHDLTPDRSILHAETLPRQGYTAVKIGSDLMVLYRTGDDRGWEDGHGALRTFSREHARTLIADVPDAAIIKVNRKEYAAARRNWENYWTWKRSRNAVRAEFEKQFGYDTKHASHLVRLLRTGRDSLLSGEIRVARSDADDLLAIRRGAYSYEEIIAMAEDLDAELTTAAAASSLPDSVSPEIVTELAAEMYQQCWHARSEEHTSERQSLMRQSYSVFGLTKNIAFRYTQNDLYSS